MNERIRQLKEQSMEWVPNMADPDTKIRLLNAEKFAELIVKECLDKIGNEAAQYAEPVWAVELVNDIKEHFRVEE